MPENQNLLTIDPGTKELVIRNGAAATIREPRNIDITGSIGTVVEWLTKRNDLVDQQRAHILVDREGMAINLKIDETNFFSTEITGGLTPHPILATFGINRGQYRTAYQMAEFFKMNRFWFENKQVAMELITQLMGFKAKIDKEVEKLEGTRGDRRHLVAQAVSTNVPEKFNLVVPIFKGGKRQPIEVEIYFNPEDMTCTLVSPALNEEVLKAVDEKIDNELIQIRKNFPGIAIVEV